MVLVQGDHMVTRKAANACFWQFIAWDHANKVSIIDIGCFIFMYTLFVFVYEIFMYVYVCGLILDFLDSNWDY